MKHCSYSIYYSYKRDTMKTLSKIAFCLSLCLLGNQAFAKDKLIVWEADQNGVQALTKVAKEFENRYDCEIELSQYDSVHQIEKVIELNSKNERSPDVFIMMSDKLGMAIHENAVSPLEFMNEENLDEMTTADDHTRVFIACKVGGVRLIDNILLGE